MSIPTMLYRHALWISAPLFVIAAAWLGYFTLSVIRLEQRSEIVSLPLLKRQNVLFREAGPAVLYIKGPRFTTRFAKLTYDMSTDDGTRVTSHSLWFRPTTSGVSTVTLGIRLYDIPRPGNYILEVHGLTADPASDDQCGIVFMRPHRARMVGDVLGIVFSGVLLVGALVLFLSRLLVAGH
jgi:hypothetical protein